MRREDIPLLVAHFASEWAMRQGKAAAGIAPEGLALLQDAPWPGNVRQLRGLIELALGQAVAPVIPASLIQRLMGEQAEKELVAFDDARRGFERDYLSQLLTLTRGNVAQAARIACRNRTEFYKLLSRHELDPATYKSR